MREHDQPGLHARRQVWLGLLVTIALPLGGLARGQELAQRAGDFRSHRTGRPRGPGMGVGRRALGSSRGRCRHFPRERGRACPHGRRAHHRHRSRWSKRDIRQTFTLKATFGSPGRTAARGARIERPSARRRRFSSERTGVPATPSLSRPPLGLKILDRAGFPGTEPARALAKSQDSTSPALGEADPRVVPDHRAVASSRK